MTNDEPIPLLFDTDIGTDIDDAVCLAYLLRHPRCELLGITTVSGHPSTRAALADAVCRAAGRQDIPIHAGNDVGINMGIVQPLCTQAEILDQYPHQAPDAFAPYTAVPFLRDQILARPGEHPGSWSANQSCNSFSGGSNDSRKLKRLVIMGGMFTWSVPAP